MSQKNTFEPLAAGKFGSIIITLREAVSQEVVLEDPFLDASDLAPFKRVVEDGSKLLPPRYHDVYLAILRQALEQAESTLSKASPIQSERIKRQLEVVFQGLAGPICQLASPDFSREIRAFHSLLSNLYRRLLDDDQIRVSARKALKWPELDPLGFFSKPGSSPY